MISTSISTTDLASALDLSRTGVLKRAERERWAYRTVGNAKVWDLDNLPRDVQIRVASDSVQDRGQIEPIVFKEAGERNRDKARLRMALLSLYQSSGMRVEDFVGAFNTGSLSKPLFDKLGTVSVPNFYRWIKSWREEGVDGIVPKWGLSAKGSRVLSALEIGYLDYWYLTPERRSASHCWKLLLHNLPDSRASYSAVLRHFNGLPLPLVDLHRLGKTRFDSLYQPYIDRDPTLYAPMDQIVSDHHCFDFVVIRDGKIFRPWITVFQDYRSAKIIGWCPSVYPSSLSILVAFYRVVSEFGTPRLIHIDNGKDYRSKVINGKTGKVKIVNEAGIEEESLIHLHGAFGLLGCDVTFSKPYHGQSKGRMERTFGSFAEYFSKETGTYLGSNTVSRLEDSSLIYRSLNKKAKRRDIYQWDDFVRGFEAFTHFWNANWRGEGKGLDGLTPDEAFSKFFRGEARTVDPETLALALTKPEIRRVKENGVTVAGVAYWAQELFEYSGRDVIVRVPLGDSDRVVVLDMKGKVLCTAIADWFKESGDLSADNKRVNEARKANLTALTAWGSHRTAPPDGGKTFIEIADLKYGDPGISFPLIGAKEKDIPRLPMAAGSEHDPEPVNSKRYKSPLDI